MALSSRTAGQARRFVLLPFGAPPHGQSPLGTFTFCLRRRSPSEAEIVLWGPALGALSRGLVRVRNRCPFFDR